ncbi:hypothetical protein D9619_000206 [Psilocybe cf. subviscida]|uniref:Structural maintenance of chromosomes protein 5 n=1 Tax=Psilocybe cf. subviscida TaxID=2480587 RepID=A0A8H5BEE1_9AGAR|nr:hypothetical protein D9619_000206 [Psilocybe cf. subviscida]
MARSATNTNGVRVKEEKHRVKAEKAKGKAPARQATEEEDDDDDDEPQNNTQNGQRGGEEDEEAADEDEDEGESPRGAKRVRVNDDGDSVPSGSQAALLPKVKTQPRGDDGYIPGSIVRIQLHNFVTYDFVEFFPGPYLNMIIGPNGTGKSSIACAIALGLNFSPNILGRASEINSFVKHGANDGYIEIELKGPRNKKNLVIRRSLNAHSKSSTFTINSASASGKEVTTKMAELNVQVGNLCSFLPQDRVTEFAAMSPQELLKQTQLAAGDENLTNWHKTLIDTGKELKDLQAKIQSEEDTVKQYKERNEGIERDVQKFKERKVIEHQIALLNVLIPVVEYKELRAEYMELKAETKKYHDRVQQLKKKNEPAHKRLKKYEQACKDAEKARSDAKDAVRAKNDKCAAKKNDADKLAENCEAVLEKLASLKKEEKARKQELKRCREEIEAINRELGKPMPEGLPNEAQLKKDHAEFVREGHAYRELHSDLETQLTEVTQRKVQYETQLHRAEAELNKQNDDDVKKLNSMARWDPATHAAILWLRANRNLFRMEVFETPFMRLNVKDPKFADAVETCISTNQLKTFVCQCQEDMDTLNHYINDTTKALGKTARINTWFRPPGKLAPQPMTPEQMYNLGFDAYAIDTVDFPVGMTLYLTQEVGLHRVPIATSTAPGFPVAQANEIIGAQGGGTYVAGKNVHQITRSRYGKRLVNSSMRGVRKAQNLSTPTVDPELERRCNYAIDEAKRNLEICDEERKPLLEKNKNLEPTRRELDQRGKDLKSRKDALVAYRAKIASLQNKISAKQQRVQVLENRPSMEQEEKKLYKKLRDLVEQRVQISRELTDLGHSVIEITKEVTYAGLKFLQVCANKEALKELVERKDAKCQTAVAQWTACKEKFEGIKVRSKEALQRSMDAASHAEPDIAEEFTGIQAEWNEYDAAVKVAKEQGGPMPEPLEGAAAMSLEELRSDLDTQTASLEMNTNTNEDIVRQYENRAQSIEQLEASLAKKKKTEEKIARDIKNARDNWQPALQTLVNSIGAKFSAAFDSIGCAGEVRISEHEDYDKWAIDILVKFRDSEKLQLLTAHRQSGGERSLTTILYLLSLTEEARAPFSLVDEINQGMDQRAERHVHNSMVNVTCKEESAQYFLITPKLLTELRYHERMKILCVNNGEWLPEESNVGNMGHMIDTYLATRGGGGAGRASM